MTTLSPCELKALVFLQGCGSRGTYTSAIGYAIAGDQQTRKKRSPQGMALFAGKFLRHLARLEFVGSAYPYQGWRITDKGAQFLASLPATTPE